MAFTTIELDTSLSADQTASYLTFADKYQGANSISDYIQAMGGGVRQGVLTVRLGAVKAAGTFTITSTGPALTNTIVIAGVTLTAVASAPTNVQFIRNNTPATAAANIATAINANTTLQGIVSATSLAGVVTVTAVQPGKAGNGLVMSTAADNTVAVSFANGSDGTTHVLSFL